MQGLSFPSILGMGISRYRFRNLILWLRKESISSHLGLKNIHPEIPNWIRKDSEASPRKSDHLHTAFR